MRALNQPDTITLLECVRSFMLLGWLNYDHAAAKMALQLSSG